jgi:hypothetical protein
VIKKLILTVILLFPFLSQAEFAQNNLRYLSPLDFLFKFDSHFTVIRIKNSDFQPCKVLTSEMRILLGANNPANGQSFSIEPTAFLLKKIDECIYTVYSLQLYEQSNTTIDQYKQNEPVYKMYFGPAYLDMKNNYPTGFPLSLYQPFCSYKKANELVNYQIERLLGPEEVLVSYGHEKSQAELTRKILSETCRSPVSIYEAIVSIMQYLAKREEYLSY